MLETKLILIEGLPGTGKTTLTQYLGMHLALNEIPCWAVTELDPHAPIRVPTSQALTEESPGIFLRAWEQLVHSRGPGATVTVIEARVFNWMALFLLLAERAERSILDASTAVERTLQPLKPVLVFLSVDDPRAAMEATVKVRGENWARSVAKRDTKFPWFRNRHLTGVDGWMEFWRPAAELQERLAAQWQSRKLGLRNAHEDWKGTYERVLELLEIPRATVE